MQLLQASGLVTGLQPLLLLLQKLVLFQIQLRLQTGVDNGHVCGVIVIATVLIDYLQVLLMIVIAMEKGIGKL